MTRAGSEGPEPPLIEIHNATVFRGATRVFDRLSLTIAQGEHVAIMGPNGAGKTTLLKLITRELYPVASDDASVRILGRERWDVWDLRRHIGMVSADLQSGFTPRATACETVLSGFFSSMGIHPQLWEEVSPDHLERAQAILHDLGIYEIRDRAFGSLSTGQQRRCLLGRALVHGPDTLVLDEPTSGLDLASSFEYLTRLAGLARSGSSLVLVTHHLADIIPEIERIVLLAEGRVVADGSKSTVLNGELLSRVYRTPIRIAESDGHYLAYPGSSSAS